MNFTSNKKGNVILETLLVLIVLFVFAIIAINGASIFSDLTAEITGDTEIAQEARDELTDLEARYPSNLDGAFALAFGLLWLVTLITSFMIDSKPAFFIVSLVLFIGVLIAGGMLSNAYGEWTDDEEISVFADEFPMSNFILDNLIIVLLLLGGSIAIVMFAKSR